MLKQPPHPIVERILQVLKDRGKSKTDLAYLIDASPSLISKWQNAGYMPSIEYIPKICEFLNVSPDYIITGKGSYTQISDFFSPGLSEDENELVAAYRKLSISQKGEFLGRIKATARG